ncbi:hypothetical protein CRE_31010 [Caenorhabditis remanei]|uniref:Uncharacterized protein n=1 Tax=Caenorhabditis remanei TaxID=31234 RepID=E3LU36_CAERE|nr:hypothetical protein CRE_31010 [Caenorhabditis remanei]
MIISPKTLIHLIQYAGFVIAHILNSTLLVLIFKRANKLFGGYRKVMAVFAFYSLIYTWIEIITQPVSQGNIKLEKFRNSIESGNTDILNFWRICRSNIELCFSSFKLSSTSNFWSVKIIQTHETLPIVIVMLDSPLKHETWIGNEIACLYCASFALVISLLAVQFYYRYIALCK